MRHALSWATLASIWACGGQEPDRYYADDCSLEWPSEPLDSISIEEWPDGLDSALTLYGKLEGRWSATACDDTEMIIKITLPPPEALEVFLQEPPGPTECGCLEDRSYRGDNAYRAVARGTVSWILDGYPDEGLNTLSVDSPLVFFEPSEPIQARACTTQDAVGDAWTQETRILRVQGGNVLGGEVILYDDVHSESCTIEGWTWLGK